MCGSSTCLPARRATSSRVRGGRTGDQAEALVWGSTPPCREARLASLLARTLHGILALSHCSPCAAKPA